MSRINTNVGSMLAQRILGHQNKSLQQSLERLSTGLQINRGADSPAGLIASEKLRSEKTAITAAIGNAERADQVVNIAEGGLQEVNALLLEVQALVGESANRAGISREEKEANQLQIDSILQTIDRIASTTSFQGVKLLNGTYDFTVTGQNNRVRDFQINAAKLEHNGTREVQLVVTASAQHGSLFLSFGAGITQLDLTNTASRFTFELTGARGSREFSFASGTRLSAIAAAVNTFKDVTGVSAAISTGGGYLKLRSDEFGSDQFVSFKLSSNGGQTGGIIGAAASNENAVGSGGSTFGAIQGSNAVNDTGQDLGAIINGIVATARGRTARVNTDFLDLSITLSAASTTTPGAQTLGSYTAFTITGGGARFNLGPNVDILNQVSVGIKNVAARNLGNVSDGYLSSLSSGNANNLVTGNLETGQKIINSAIDLVSGLRGRLGAFQKNIVGATIRSLSISLENTSAAESAIRDTDFAKETASLTRAQILVQSATSVLGTANTQPQNVLALLGR